MTIITSTPPPQPLVDFLKKKRGLPEVVIAGLMAHNIMTINQVAALTGQSLSAINSLIRPRYKKENTYTVLTPCYPFPEMVLETGEPEEGRVFILRDEKFYQYLQRKLG